MRFIILFSIVMQSVLVRAQSIDYNKIILPDHISPENFEEKLVQLAWKNHPSNKIVLQNVSIAQKEKHVAQWRWLDDIYANGNLNEYTINPSPETPSNVFYPRYNFGVRISLGTFVNTPLQTKLASNRITNTLHEVNERKLLVREEVLGNVEKLKQSYKFLKLREQIKEDFLTMYKDAEKKFATGDVDIEKYRSAVQSYYGQAEKVVESQTNFNSAKILIESLVGIPLQEIEGYQQFIQVLDAEVKIE